jgi:thiol-disulfide isomerase/thioredoxin
MRTVRTVTIAAAGCLIALLSALGDAPAPVHRAKEIPSFLKDFHTVQKACEDQIGPLEKRLEDAYNAAKTDAERKRAFESHRSQVDSIIAQASKAALNVLRPRAADPEAIEPLVWITKYGYSDTGQAAANLLFQYHLMHPKTLDLTYEWGRSAQSWVAPTLRAQLADPNLPPSRRPKQLRALAVCLQYSAVRKQGDPAKLEGEAIELFTELAEKYGNVPIDSGLTFGELGKASIFEIQHLGIGKTSPDIEGQDLDGTAFKLSDYRGKVVLLSFWATWCGPCMALVPHERELAARYKGKPFVIIGVNADLKKEQVKPVLKEQGITWRSFWCGEEGPNGTIPKQWNVTGWPKLYLIDRAGVIRRKGGRDLDAMIAKLVAEAEAVDERRAGLPSAPAR